MRARVSLAVLATLALAACVPRQRAPSSASAPEPALQQSGNAAPAGPAADPSVQSGKATFYGEKFRGRKTASGARFNPDAFTCAHRTLPFGTQIEVRRVDTNQTVQVTVTDRGPFGHPDRIIDLSLAAARALNMTKLGVIDVELRVIGH